MSAIITVEREGEAFEVEVFRNGKITFPNDDLRYGQACQEFYGSKTAVVSFSDLWNRSKMEAIAEYLWIIHRPFLLFMADCAEHVLLLLKDRYPWMSGSRRALEIVRTVSAHGLAVMASSADTRWDIVGELQILETEISSLARKFQHPKKDNLVSCVLFAVSEVADRNQPVWRCDKPADSYVSAQFLFAATTAAKAAAVNAYSDRDHASWKRAYNKEVAWQIRRFVDIMEAVGQGLDWPDLGATK